MKKNLLLTLTMLGLLSIDNHIQAQTSNWTWAKQIADTSSEQGSGIATDSLGNVYTAGAFQGPSLTIGTTTLTNMGKADVYFTKYNSGGNVVWAKRIGGSDNDFSGGVAMDKSGNVYVAGGFISPTLNLGSMTLTNTAGSGGADIFLAKYDTNGNLIWAKNSNASYYSQVNALCVDGSGNPIITGIWGGTLTIGSNTLSPVGTGFNIFAAKFDSNGNALWARTSGGIFYSTVIAGTASNGISTDGSGNVYVSGYTGDSTYTFGTTTLTTSGPGNGLLLKYSSSGTPLWALNIPNGGIVNFPLGVTTDVAGNSVITGFAIGSTFIIGTNTLTTSGTGNIFLVKFNASGNVVWAKSIGSTGADPRSITSDATGNIYFTGALASPSISFGSTTLNRMGSQDIFVAKYDASGNAIWAKNAFGKGAYGNGICVDKGGDVYITGFYNDSAATFGSTILTNAGKYDAFIAKLSGTTGIKEISSNNSAFIYPNPFTTTANIKFDKNIENATIRIYNVSGQTVKEINNFSGKEYTLSREDLNAGMYFLQILNKDKIIVSGKINIAD